VHLIGYSLGARLALGIALRHPGLVSRLSLISGHPGLNTEPERALRRASDGAWCELLQTQGIAAFVDAWQAQALWASQVRLPVATREQKRKERLCNTALGLCRSLRVTGLAEMPNFAPLLAQVRVPTDVVAGELDSKFCELARVLARGLEQGRLAIIPGAGHDLLLEQPALITQLIRGT
jgi:2-succinyl-6-hydroxy-2,4-cyclohexadiene-1-carboxylate synthase